MDLLAQSVQEMTQKGWTLTFQDEFDGTVLDQSKWNLGYNHWGIINHELQAYVPDAFTVQGGLLSINAEHRQAEYGGKTMEYTSGAITTLGKFQQEYGYFEARCKVPSGKGFWPAFWLLPADLSWPPEIDIFEYIGDQKNTLYFHNHYKDGEGKHQAEGFQIEGPDYSVDFHTIAVDWEPEFIAWYVDGKEVARSAKGIPKGPFYILLNLAVGGDWPGPPSASTVFPSQFQIDYVRVYQHVR
jgi:beta-glucanase (GH16 family)